MKGLDTLIKLHKRALDELRRKIVALERQKAQFLEMIKKLEDELRHEIETAAEQPQMSQFFGGFARRIRDRQERAVTEIKKLDKEIATLTDAAAAAYGEVKKFEIAKQNADKRALKEAGRKETVRLDEIAGVQDRRKKKNKN